MGQNRRGYLVAKKISLTTTVYSYHMAISSSSTWVVSLGGTIRSEKMTTDLFFFSKKKP